MFSQRPTAVRANILGWAIGDSVDWCLVAEHNEWHQKLHLPAFWAGLQSPSPGFDSPPRLWGFSTPSPTRPQKMQVGRWLCTSANLARHAAGSESESEGLSAAASRQIPATSAAPAIERANACASSTVIIDPADTQTRCRSSISMRAWVPLWNARFSYNVVTCPPSG